MQRDVETWDDYGAKVREFDAVLEHSKAVCSSLVGMTVPSKHAGYGEQIFVKLLSHGIVLRRLTADPTRRTPIELCDVPSLSAVARSAIEAHDAFEYVAGHSVPDSGRGFRLLLWDLRGKTRRLRMLQAIGSSDPRMDEIRAAAGRVRAELMGHEFYASLRTDRQRKVNDDDPPAFHLSQRERCTASGINHDWYSAVTMQLSGPSRKARSMMLWRALSQQGTKRTADPLAWNATGKALGPRTGLCDHPLRGLSA
jgi:hypothetical protein